MTYNLINLFMLQGLTADELPQSVKEIIINTQFSVPRIETTLKFGSLLLLIFVIVGIIFIIRRGKNAKSNLPGPVRLERNISGLDSLIENYT